MDRNVSQAVGDYDLGQVAVFGSSGTPINITNQVKEINIYQDIDTPFITGTLVISDVQTVSEITPFLGQERLVFTLKTPGGFPLNFTDYHAVIFNVERRFQDSDRSQTLLLNFTTLECYRNIRTKISRSFSTNISEMPMKF